MKAVSLLTASSLLGVLAVVSGAQEVRPEIQGTILEPGILHPIADVEISLFAFPERIPGRPTIMAPTTKEPLQTARTDPQGAFRFTLDKFGEYSLQLKKEGYGQTQTVLRQLIAGPMGSSTTVMVDKEHPVRQLQFFLAKPGTISGQLVDEETGKPISGVSVGLWMAGWQWGLRRIAGGAAGKTDAEGRFTIPNRTPGDYLVGVAGASRPQAQADPEPKWPRIDYPRTFWPGVTDPDGAMIVTLPSGGTVNLGQLRVRQATRYQARIELATDYCEAGQKVTIQLITRKGPFTSGDTAGQAICGQPFFLGPFEPGSYTVKIQQAPLDDQARRIGLATFQVVDKDVKAHLAFERGIDLDGRFVLAEGVAKVSLAGALFGLDSGGSLGSSIPTPADEGGRFPVLNMLPGDYRVLVSGLPQGLYAKEVRYNGNRVDGTMSVNAGALAQTIVSGVVKLGDRAVSQAWVILKRWPSDPEAYVERRPAGSDSEGRFQFTGLAPGEYRVFAVEQQYRLRLEEPGVWERMLSAGQKLTLDPGAFQNITLAPADPNH